MRSRTLLTPSLIESIQRGDAILFLGAGATFGAKGPKGEEAPSGERLRDGLCDRFLGGALKSKPLSQVAELAKNEAGLPAVQQYIKELFVPLQPAPFHLLIPTFRWYAIVTTNFDLVLERAYDMCAGREQILAPTLRDGDNFSDKIRDPSQVLYLKLHGSITHVNDANLPLILASEEYARHSRNRVRLFRHFADWARERPVVFCGYDVGDPNIQQILFDLADLGVQRPYYGLVNPGLDDIQERYWSTKRFSVYRDTFETFLRHLDETIPRPSRTLSALVKTDGTSLRPWIKIHSAPSTRLLAYLQNELVHVHKGMALQGVSPLDFYTGKTIDWGVYQEKLDVRRRVADDMILEAFLDKSKTKAAQAYVLKGHAGSGKSVTLRRIAWDIAHDLDGLIFFLKEGGLLRQDEMSELYTLTGERLYIVIEDGIPHVDEIQDLLAWSARTKTPLTLIFGARNNEWNYYAAELASQIENDYELRDLTEREIQDLLEKLTAHDALGRLEKVSAQERVDHFRLTAERQLLVALHDLSSEKPFEEIVFDEYRNIRPVEAQVLYLDVCTLHRLAVGVRAGLISRVSGISFERFQRDFFKPLEHVVRTYDDYGSRDHMYRSRHPLIAEMVFRQALPDAVERANQITRIIRNMDVDYSSDQSAFRQIVRGRVLADLFANKAIAYQVFDAARESGASLAVVEHQRAVFEMNHPNGDLKVALAAIEKAEQSLDYTDKAVLHTKATILRDLALKSPHGLVRQKLREDAKAILRKQTTSSRVSHPFHLTAQILIDEIRDKLRDMTAEGPLEGSELQQRTLTELIRQAEQMIFEGLQRFPGDDFLLTVESELGRLLDDEKRAAQALGRAFEASPGRTFVAVRYARYQAQQGNLQGAIDILQKSIAANPVGKETHLALAKLLMTKGEEQHKTEISYQLARSFTPGDSNFDAQFWNARHAFLYGDKDVAIAAFRQLGEAETPPEYRTKVKGVVVDSEAKKPRRFAGPVRTLYDSFCFIRCAELKADVYAHCSEFDQDEWSRTHIGSSVDFELGFTFKGPSALHVVLKNQ